MEFIKNMLDKTDLDEKLVEGMAEFVDEVDEKIDEIHEKLSDADFSKVNEFVDVFKKTYKEVTEDGKISKEDFEAVKESFKEIKGIVKDIL